MCHVITASGTALYLLSGCTVALCTISHSVMETCHWQIDRPITFLLSAPWWDQLNKRLQYFIPNKEQPVQCSYAEWLDVFSVRYRGSLALKRHSSQQASAKLPTWSHHRADNKRSTANCVEICHCIRKGNCYPCQCWCTVLPTTAPCGLKPRTFLQQHFYFFMFSDIGAFFYPVVFGFSLFRPYWFAFSSGSSIDIKLLNITQNKNDIKIPYFILRLDKIITKLTGVKSTANNNVINQLFFWPQFG